MPIVTAGGGRFDVDAIVFDKDGTLIDFDQLWGPRTARWVERLVAEAGQPDAAAPLYSLLGFDADARRVVADGPLAISSTADIFAIAAAVLCGRGYGWHEARPLVVGAAATTMLAPPEPAEILPLGDVVGTFRRLRAAGLQLAIATNDDRALTVATLVQLGVDGAVAALACGDDRLPPKPDPAGLRWLAAEMGTAPARLLVVGDSANDMLAARHAGAAGCLGIPGGAGSHASLRALADGLIGSVEELGVEG